MGRTASGTGWPRPVQRVRAACFAAQLAAVLLLAVPRAAAEQPTLSRTEYVSRVERICRRDVGVNKRILAGVRGMVKRGELSVAGRRFVRSSNAFGRSVARIAAVPRPAEDAARLGRWLRALGTFKTRLRWIGAALNRGNRVRANHQVIRAERSGNAANNVGFIFEFHYCHFDSSRFS